MMMDETKIESHEQKRVLVLISDAFGSGGGIAKFNRDLLTAASASPMVSDVVAVTRIQPNPPKDLPEKLIYDTGGIGKDCHCIRGKINYIREVAHVLYKNRQVDLVICGLIDILPVAYIASRIKRAPLWLIIHGIDAWQPDHSRLVNWIARHTDGIIAVSELTKQRFIEWSGVPAEWEMSRMKT